MIQTQVETIEEFQVAQAVQQASALGHEPVLLQCDDSEDDGFELIDKEH